MLITNRKCISAAATLPSIDWRLPTGKDVYHVIMQKRRGTTPEVAKTLETLDNATKKNYSLNQPMQINSSSLDNSHDDLIFNRFLIRAIEISERYPCRLHGGLHSY